jgi:hypothetical protein
MEFGVPAVTHIICVVYTLHTHGQQEAKTRTTSSVATFPEAPAAYGHPPSPDGGKFKRACV